MSNFSINISFFGNGPRGAECLKYLISQGRKINLVIGHNDQSKLKEIADNAGIEFIHPAKINDASSIEKLKSTDSNLFLLCGYSKILKSGVLDIPRYGVVNCHGGKLPEYRGTAPINWQLINGEEIVGFSILYANEGIDTGAIIDETRFEIDGNCTANDLIQKSLEWFPSALDNVVDKLEQTGQIADSDQDEAAAVHYNRRYPEDGLILWNQMTDYQVHNLIRALVPPYPGAFGFVNGQKVVCVDSEILEEEYRGVAGRVSMKKTEGVYVQCSNRSLLLKKVQVDGVIQDARTVLKVGEKFTYEGTV